MKKLLIAIILLGATCVQAATTIQFIPNPVQQGSAVEMILSSDTPFNGVPNIEILKNNFLIGGQQKRQSSQWINGKGSTLYELAYTLFPYEAGTIQIQGLKIADEQLPTTTLTVQPKNQTKTAQQQQNIEMSVQCNKTSVFPGQKILCNVLLLDPLGVSDGQIIPPETTDGVWEQVSPPTLTGTTNRGQQYTTSYSFLPKQTGNLKMPPFTFQGEVFFNTRPKSKYNSFVDMLAFVFEPTAMKPVIIQSNPIQLTVKEIPQNYTGWWLPSTNVTLKETFNIPNTIHIGDPIQRIVTLTAADAAADSMPIPSASSTKFVKVYTNPETRQDLPGQGQVTVEMTFVPTQSGTITLPAISVPWFDTKSDTIQQASLPEKEIVVVGDEEVQPKQTIQPAQPTPTAQTTQNMKTDSTNPVATQNIPWLWLLIVIPVAFVLGIVLTYVFLKNKLHNASNKEKKKKPLPDLYPF